MKINIKAHGLVPILILIGCFALLPKVPAVVPPPDGGYPNFTTAEGQKALFSLTTGAANTAVGWFSLFSDTQGSFNTATGAGTLLFNTADNNTAFGAAALLFNTIGHDNTAVGTAALLNNIEGNLNTAMGQGALATSNGSFNTAVGAGALLSNTTGPVNTANGAFALFSNTTGGFNTANGYQALLSNTTGTKNTAIGLNALQNNSSGADNTAIGYQALLSNNTAGANTAIGFSALENSTGNGNTAVGFGAGDSVTGASNVICIGTTGNDVSNSCYIGSIAGQTVGAGGSTCYVDNDGKLGVFLSARRFKTDIADMGAASEALLAMRPVTFRYKPELDKIGIPQFGLVAEEVEAINPDLVTRDKEGKVSTVRYEAVNAMLLNEFLKEHKAFLEEKRKVQRLESALDAVSLRLKEQEAKIEEVSARVEVNKPAQQVVKNN